MRKFTIAIVALLALAFLSSCLPETPDPPEGVWISDNPRIILHLRPEYRNMPRQDASFSYLGIFLSNGKETRALVSFGNANNLRLLDIAYSVTRERSSLVLGHVWGGTWRMVDDSIVVRTSQGDVAFNRAYVYEPINLSEWFPDLFHNDALLPTEGIWMGRYPRIIMHIKPQYKNIPAQNGSFSYLAVLITEDEEIRLIAEFLPSRTIAFHDITMLCEDGFVSEYSRVLSGTWLMEGVWMNFESEKGNTHFENVYSSPFVSVDSIDLAEWFPDFFPEGGDDNEQP